MLQPSKHCPAEVRLSTFFHPSRDSFSDAEIEEIKRVLLRCPHYSFASSAPRTFIVLCHIGQLEFLEPLLGEEFRDSWFPVGKSSLPSFLDPRIKAAIVEHQHIILTKSIDLEKGVHCYLDENEEPPYNLISYIGNGSFGQVCQIESKVTCKPYALKTVRRRAAYGPNSRHIMREFITEMKIMKRLRHPHIVQYIGSYTDKKDLGLVMSPVADCDLAVFLKTYCTQPAWYPTLRTFYGCLASALAYLHDSGIKHRDVKPHNILVYKASVLLTDFGLSHESIDTTSGTKPGTARYQSPEVAASDKRNATTDVWSLGCVFVEMLAALNGCNVDWLKTYYSRTGSRKTHFHDNASATRQLLAYWRTIIPLNFAKPIIWIEAMLVEGRHIRPTAAHIAAEITASGDSTRFMYSCKACGDDHSDSDSMLPISGSVISPASARTNRRKRHGANASRHVPASKDFISVITQHGEYNIDHVGFPCDGAVYTYCRPVPVMFGKCIEHILTNEGQEFRGSLISQPFARTGSEERHVQLKREFEMAPDHGKGIDLNRYALRDCVSVLLEYLATIPELLGRKRATTKRQVPRLRSEKDFAVLLSTLPEPNLELILVAIAFFAAYAELGRAHASLYKNPSLSYLELIHRLAELFYSVVVRPLDSSDRLSIQTLELVLKTPLRFRSIAMMERSKRAQNRNQIPSQPLFRKQVEAPADDEVGQEVCGSQSWSKCATEGEEPEQNSYATDKEACSSDDVNVEDYDSEWFDAIEPEQVPSEVQSIQDKEAVDIPKDISQVPHDPSSQTRADLPRSNSRLHESRLIRRRDTAEETLAKMASSITIRHSVSLQQEKPEPREPFRPELWGLSVSDATSIAGQDIDCMSFTIYGEAIPFSGRVPIVVAKCIEKVICTHDGAEDTATYCLRSGLYQSNPEHFAQLKETLNAPASSYGIDIDWSKYTATDAIDVLFDYLKSLREPLLPIDLSCKLPSLDSYLQRTYAPSDWDSLQVYAICLAKLPECNRQLLLVLIAFLASQVECAERTICNDHVGFHNEAALRWGSVLSHPLDYRTATFTLLMVNAIYFLRKANGKSPTHAEWDELIRARKKIVLEAEDLPKDLAQAIGEKSTADPKQKDADSASPGMSEDYTHGQLQGHGGASTEDQEDQREQEDDDTDRRGSGDGLQLGHQPNVEDTVSKEDKETQNMPVDNDGFALKEKVKPSERGWSWEPLDFQDTEFDDMVKIRTATEIGGSEDESQSLVVLTPDLHPPPSDAQFEPDSCSIVESSHDHGVEHLHHDDSNIVKQDATGQSHIQPAVSRSQTPQEPVVAADINGTGWRQFLEGVSSPPTPKLVTKLPHTPLPELSITPVDDAAFIEAPFDDQLHEENLTPRQLGPMEPLPEQDRANHGEANATVRKKRSHRKSGGGWTSHPNHSRPKSVAGESVKSESRKSKDDERKRNTDEGAAETAQKQGHSGKKQQRKKSNGSFRRPEKGFREWLHGVRK